MIARIGETYCFLCVGDIHLADCDYCRYNYSRYCNDIFCIESMAQVAINKSFLFAVSQIQQAITEHARFHLAKKVCVWGGGGGGGGGEERI